MILLFDRVIGGSIALLCLVTYNRKKEDRKEIQERVTRKKEQASSD
jgi:positive regulator of sigma E activity